MAVKPDHVSPWGLTPRQAAVMDALVEHGSNKGAARGLSLSLKTVEAHLSRAVQKMGGGSRLVRLLAWDRWRRSAANGATK